MDAVLGTSEIIVGDLMLCEVLQGLDSERAAQEVETLLRRFKIVSMAGDAIDNLRMPARLKVVCGRRIRTANRPEENGRDKPGHHTL